MAPDLASLGGIIHILWPELRLQIVYSTLFYRKHKSGQGCKRSSLVTVYS